MRKMIGIFLGAMIAMACSFMAPALAVEQLPQLSAVYSAQAKPAMVVAISVTQDNHATASASAERLCLGNESLMGAHKTTYTATSMPVIALEVDHSPGTVSILLLANPGEGSDDDDGDGMKLAA